MANMFTQVCGLIKIDFRYSNGIQTYTIIGENDYLKPLRRIKLVTCSLNNKFM